MSDPALWHAMDRLLTTVNALHDRKFLTVGPRWKFYDHKGQRHRMRVSKSITHHTDDAGVIHKLHDENADDSDSDMEIDAGSRTPTNHSQDSPRSDRTKIVKESPRADSVHSSEGVPEFDGESTEEVPESDGEVESRENGYLPYIYVDDDGKKHQVDYKPGNETFKDLYDRTVRVADLDEDRLYPVQVDDNDRGSDSSSSEAGDEGSDDDESSDRG